MRPVPMRTELLAFRVFTRHNSAKALGSFATGQPASPPRHPASSLRTLPLLLTPLPLSLPCLASSFTAAPRHASFPPLSPSPSSNDMRLLSSLIPHSARALTPAPPPAALPLPHDLVTNISSAASADAFLATLNKFRCPSHITANLCSSAPPLPPSRLVVGHGMACPGTSFGATSFGSTSFGATSFGATSFGSTSFGATSFGSTSFGSTSFLSTSFGSTSFGSTSFGATSFPTLFLHKADGTRQLYDGPLKPEPIEAFLEQFAAPAEPAADSATAGEAEAGGAGAAGEEGQSEECREVKEKFEKAAEELVGMALTLCSPFSLVIHPHPQHIFVPAFWGSLAIAALCLIPPAHSCLSFPAHSCFSSPAH
ncbi:unnamed protein product [Closterium sp. Naga37s-1]|nr:unnamed protein product [Closterium sp. Naga37s-1]